MCGIVGYVGKNNAIQVLINGLKTLEYRGYDSAGIAYVKDNKIKIIKEKGKIVNLEQTLTNDEPNIGIGHTRWATHGVPSKENSHPHRQGKITIVHNGIIENYKKLKEELLEKGYVFKSETDTEIACAMIDYLYQEEKDMLKVIDKAQKIFEGSYAFGIICDDELDTIYTTRKDSPLIIGTSKEQNFIASDVPAILKYTNKYILLDNYEIGKITKKEVLVYSNLELVNKKINTFDFDISAAIKDGYDHFMLKEINEQPELIKNVLEPYIKDKDINNIKEKLPDFAKYNQIHIVACGSAYHAGLVGKILIEEYGNIPVKVDIASEYRYNKLFLDNKTLVIAISQSGETADTLASLRIAKERGCDTLGIVNVVGSSIAREVDNVIYLNAGCEIAVATTKAYSIQVLILSLIALKIGIDKKIITDIDNIFDSYQKLPECIEKVINTNYQDIVKKIYKKEDIYFIGRNIDYATSLEGSLKLKEISYIHSECYAAGELKHGSIALIDEGTPVIAVVTEKNIAEKTISNIKEVKARGAYVILVTTNDIDTDIDFYDKKIVIDNLHKLSSPILTTVPLQLLSYEIAKLRGCDIDQPRNLAKSVTVE